jgi:glycosyltransferase involved in cell wall biosynthesis
MPKIAPFPVIPLMEKAFKKAGKVVWDIDDDIFQAKEITKKETALLKKYSNQILVTAPSLFNYFPTEKYNIIQQVSTTDGDFVGDDINKLMLDRKKRYDNGELAMVWLASYTSLPFVQDIVPYLDDAARIISERLNKKLVLEIVCNRPLKAKTQYLEVKNLVWTRELAHNRASLAHVGIYPVRNTIQSQGKGGFKLLQYMSIALPSISSNVGMVKEIVTNNVDGVVTSCENLSDWTEKLVLLVKSWQNIEQMGMNAKKTWDENYSYFDNLKKLTKILCEE